MKKWKVGIIGCGAIGSALAKILSREFHAHAVLSCLCDRKKEKAERLARALSGKIRIVSLGRLILSCDLIIEAASAAVSARIAEESLARNKNVLIMSVGGLLAGGRIPRLLKRSRGKLWIPSGAVAGVDALLAAREAKVRGVKLLTTKPAAALEHAPYFLRRKFPVLRGRRPRCVFKGSAREAIRAFPQNINVAAILSLAGIGASRTRVEIWASRASRTNRHEVVIEGDFGKMRAVSENVPSPANPKTSYLAILSAAATLRRIFSPLQLGT